MIKINSLKKLYGSRVVLNINNLEFEEGKIYAVIGANGSGKTTLLKVMDGVVGFDKGEIIYSEGMTIGYMPQAAYAFSMSVKRNIMLPVKCCDKKAAELRADDLINKLGLLQYAKKNATKLSGGETQRMALARALMVDCMLLLLDEPTSALDVEQAKLVIELIKREHIAKGNTIFFATHSFKQAEALADEVLFMHGGKVLERGVPTEVLHNPKTQEARAFINFNS